VRADRIGVIGFSHGGRTVLSAVQGGSAPPPSAAAVALYPGCDERVHFNIAVPTLILAGEKDDWTPVERCRAVVRGLTRPELVSITVYPNAYHGFDRDSAGVVMVRGSRGDHRVERDPEAAPDAMAKTRAFFDQRLKG
jgi:dienelactone hydrolase